MLIWFVPASSKFTCPEKPEMVQNIARHAGRAGERGSNSRKWREQHCTRGVAKGVASNSEPQNEA